MYQVRITCHDGDKFYHTHGDESPELNGEVCEFDTMVEAIECGEFLFDPDHHFMIEIMHKGKKIMERW